MMNRRATVPTLAERFEAWLLAKKPSQVVGRPRMGRSCPVARFLYQEGAKRFSVWPGSDTAAILSTRYGLWSLPPELRCFVRLVDDRYRDPICASQALQTWAAAKRQATP
jgi:hypothetical protein